MKKMFIFGFLLFLGIIVILAGCATPSSTNPDSDSSEPALDRQDRLQTETPLPQLEPVENPDSTQVVGEVPDDLLEAIIADLISKTDSDRNSIEILHAQSVIWNDGSLGCPQPGEFYTQSLMEGFQVVLRVGESEYNYHASDTGYFFICENSDRIPVSPPQDPGDGSAPKQ